MQRSCGTRAPTDGYAPARHLDGPLSTDDVPAHSSDRVEKLVAGDIVEIDLANSGAHVIHTGGQHATYLQLPVRAR